MHHAINEYQIRLDVQRFLWPMYYIDLFTQVLYFASWGVMYEFMSMGLLESPLHAELLLSLYLICRKVMNVSIPMMSWKKFYVKRGGLAPLI